MWDVWFLGQIKYSTIEHPWIINEMEEPPTKKIKVFTEDTFTNVISIEIIPIEVLCIIFLHLDRQSVKIVTATCKLWLETIQGDSKWSSHVCLSTSHIPQKGLDKRIGDSNFPLVGWPVLKTIEFRGYYSYLSTVEKILQHFTSISAYSPRNGPNELNWQCCLTGSSKTAPRS